MSILSGGCWPPACVLGGPRHLMSGGCGQELEPLTCAVLPTRVFGSQNLTTVKLKGVGESFQKYPDYESKGIKAHFNLDESGVLSLDRVSAERGPVCREARPSSLS